MAMHEQKLIEGFSKKYGVTRLVYYEMHATMPEAISREKQLKKWKRDWKIRIIEEMNPDWLDMHDEIDAIATLIPPKAGPLPSQG